MEKNDLIIESNTLEEEKKNLDEIFSCINNKTNWCFDAGAGERVIIVMGAICVIKSRVSGTLNKYISCIA